MANAPVESKVSMATLGTLLASVGVAVLNGVVADSSLLGSWPAWSQVLVILVAPTLITFLSGYAAPHTPRPEDDTATPGYSR